jgi:hypothetical protein
MSKIDLGRKLRDMVSVEPMDSDDTHYPTLHIDDVEDQRVAEMPDSGTLTIHYKIRNRTHTERKGKDSKKHTCSLTMDVTGIDPPPAKAKKKNGDSDGGARKAFSDYWKDKDKDNGSKKG